MALTWIHWLLPLLERNSPFSCTCSMLVKAEDLPRRCRLRGPKTTELKQLRLKTQFDLQHFLGGDAIICKVNNKPAQLRPPAVSAGLFPLFFPFRVCTFKSEHSGRQPWKKASTTPLVSPRGSFGSALGGGLVPKLRVCFHDPQMWDTMCSMTLTRDIFFCFGLGFFPQTNKSFLSHALVPSVFNERKITLNLTLCCSCGVCQHSRTPGAAAEDL